MNLKDLVWFLCAIALSTSKEIKKDDDTASYAYSSVYRSFDTPAITKDEGVKTSSSSAEKMVHLSNPFYETIWTQEEEKPKPDEGAREITSEKTLDNAAVKNQAPKTVNENNKMVSETQTETSSSKNTSDSTNAGSNQVITTTASVITPVHTKAQSSPPLTMPIIQPGRLITPGLSAYASPKEEEENKYAEVPDDDSESKESHEIFDGFSSW